jgi:hypothetical protein
LQLLQRCSHLHFLRVRLLHVQLHPVCGELSLWHLRPHLCLQCLQLHLSDLLQHRHQLHQLPGQHLLLPLQLLHYLSHLHLPLPGHLHHLCLSLFYLSQQCLRLLHLPHQLPPPQHLLRHSLPLHRLRHHQRQLHRLSRQLSHLCLLHKLQGLRLGVLLLPGRMSQRLSLLQSHHRQLIMHQLRSIVRHMLRRT